MEEVRNYRKIVCIKNIFENGCWEDAYSSSYPSGCALGHKLQKPSNESGLFQSLTHLGTNSIVFFAKRQNRKGGGGSMA